MSFPNFFGVFFALNEFYDAICSNNDKSQAKALQDLLFTMPALLSTFHATALVNWIILDIYQLKRPMMILAAITDKTFFQLVESCVVVVVLAVQNDEYYLKPYVFVPLESVVSQMKRQVSGKKQAIKFNVFELRWTFPMNFSC